MYPARAAASAIAATIAICIFRLRPGLICIHVTLAETVITTGRGGASAPGRYEVNLDIHERPASSALCRGDIVATVTQDEVLSALKQCYDPEIPVNIVDLGLIYDVHFEAAPEEKQDVKIDMTLTSQGCPAHVMIGEQVKARLEQLPGIRNASVNVVWTPPWSPERLSPEARKQLGIE